MEEGVEVAWNCVKLGGLREIERQKLLAEVELLKQLNHKNIIRFLRSWLAETPAVDGEGPKEYRFNFITEKCSDNLRKCEAVRPRPTASEPKSQLPETPPPLAATPASTRRSTSAL